MAVVPAKQALDVRARRIVRVRRRIRFALIALALLIVLLVLAARSARVHGRATDHDLFHQQRFAVVEVLSGDGLRLADAAGEVFVVRLIGIDCSGLEEARALLADLCGQEVMLYLESSPTRNSAGELLAYVYGADGDMVNAKLVEAGLAFADRRWDYSFARLFAQLEEQAAMRKRGMWPQMTSERMPDWRRRWLAEMRKEPWERSEWRREDEP